jgi:hypothetical protein
MGGITERRRRGLCTVQRVKAEMSAALVGVMAGADVTTHAVRAMEARWFAARAALLPVWST